MAFIQQYFTIISRAFQRVNMEGVFAEILLAQIFLNRLAGILGYPLYNIYT
jgi:hypothetical protein